ncbi:MAG TPA: phenylalanine--tRNA ligase subunit alpha [Tepidisphaeraceae bacterium]|jgi:phenylalanyl-tRNA synthetase alpha chain
MADVLGQIEELAAAAEDELRAVKNAAELEQFRIKYLGTKGLLKAKMSLIGEAPADQKKQVGQKLNAVKERITVGFEARKGEMKSTAAPSGPMIDITEPGKRPEIGRRHILMQVADELVDLFARMGFAVATGPEVEDEFHNFVALNIPRQHPARDPLDNFYLSAEEGSGAENAERRTQNAEQRTTDNGQRTSKAQHSELLLRTQTSTVQIRVMEKQKPPIRVVIPGRVYRPDTHDDTHLSMFHQLEALVVDKNVTMVDLKSTVIQFVHAYFGQDTRVRFRPSFFPFTEPSAEVDVWFPTKGKWIELGGCGMVHPNVLKAVKIDPEVYSGWAFGFGIERIAMRRYGIPNIRLFVENDVRFLKQF